LLLVFENFVKLLLYDYSYNIIIKQHKKFIIYNMY
jgi:hypothetical protein